MRASVDRDAGSSIALSGIFYAIAAQLERIQTLEPHRNHAIITKTFTSAAHQLGRPKRKE